MLGYLKLHKYIRTCMRAFIYPGYRTMELLHNYYSMASATTQTTTQSPKRYMPNQASNKSSKSRHAFAMLKTESQNKPLIEPTTPASAISVKPARTKSLEETITPNNRIMGAVNSPRSTVPRPMTHKNSYPKCATTSATAYPINTTTYTQRLHFMQTGENPFHHHGTIASSWSQHMEPTTGYDPRETCYTARTRLCRNSHTSPPPRMPTS